MSESTCFGILSSKHHVSLENNDYLSSFQCDWKKGYLKGSPTKSDLSFHSRSSMSSVKSKDCPVILNLAENCIQNKLFPTDTRKAYIEDLQMIFSSGKNLRDYFISLKSGKTCLKDLQWIMNKCHENLDLIGSQNENVRTGASPQPSFRWIITQYQ